MSGDVETAREALLRDATYEDDGEWIVACYNEPFPDRLDALIAAVRAEYARETGVQAAYERARAESAQELAALREAAAEWETFYDDVETYSGGERGMTQLDHGHEEYEARMTLMVALRAALAATPAEDGGWKHPRLGVADMNKAGPGPEEYDR